MQEQGRADRSPADCTSVYRLAQQWNITGESVMRQSRGGDAKMDSITISNTIGTDKRNIALLNLIDVKSLSFPPMASLRSIHKDFHLKDLNNEYTAEIL